MLAVIFIHHPVFLLPVWTATAYDVSTSEEAKCIADGDVSRHHNL